MRRMAALLVLPVVSLSLLAGCGGGSTAKKSVLPSTKGSYGDKPDFTFPTKTPPSTEMSTDLKEGTGAVVAKGDLLIADYEGQIWNGKVFDNSYDRKQPAGFVIGTGKVITGWDDILVGKKVGSRVLMSLPPAKGYGATGNAQAGIKGTDTLVFIVDIVATYGPSSAGDPKAVAQTVSTPGLTIAGAPGTPASVAVKKGTASPKKLTATVLAKGTGAPVVPGLLVLQFAASGYDGSNAGSTWTDGAPAAFPLADTASGTPFDAVRGLPLGSRVLLQIPAASGRTAIAVVADLVAEPKEASAT